MSADAQNGVRIAFELRLHDAAVGARKLADRLGPEHLHGVTRDEDVTIAASLVLLACGVMEASGFMFPEGCVQLIADAFVHAAKEMGGKDPGHLCVPLKRSAGKP